jgi:hypothetical protein
MVRTVPSPTWVQWQQCSHLLRGTEHTKTGDYSRTWASSSGQRNDSGIVAISS